MKKMMALLLAAMMVLGLTGTALAYDEEITWQGIPWGSNVEEVIRFLMENNFIESEPNVSSGYFAECFTFLTEKGIEAIPGKDYDTDYWNACASLEITPEEYKIGGYDIEDITFNFAANGDSESLISVVVRNRAWDDAARKDLTNKINRVYGNNWIGANNTAICFVERGGIWDYNYLVYSKTDAVTTLKEAFEHVPVGMAPNQNGTEGI